MSWVNSSMISNTLSLKSDTFFPKSEELPSELITIAPVVALHQGLDQLYSPHCQAVRGLHLSLEGQDELVTIKFMVEEDALLPPPPPQYQSLQQQHLLLLQHSHNTILHHNVRCPLESLLQMGPQ